MNLNYNPWKIKFSEFEFSLPLSLSLTHTHTLSLSLSLSHTHTHRGNPHTRAFRLYNAKFTQLETEKSHNRVCQGSMVTLQTYVTPVHYFATHGRQKIFPPAAAEHAMRGRRIQLRGTICALGRTEYVHSRVLL